MKKILAIALALLCVIGAFGCSSKEESNLPEAGKYPMSYTDPDGKVVTLEKEPEKIISLAPNCTEILFAIGAGDKVVGVSNWCTYPEEAATKEKVGDTFSVNVERIIELEADLVVVTGSFATDTVSALAGANIPVLNLEFGKIDDVYTGIQLLGRFCNLSEAADELAESLKSDLAALEKAVAGTEKRKVFIDLGDLYSSSKMDFLGNLFEKINAENIAYDFDYSSPQLSAESVIEKNPDVYICLSSEASFTKPAGFDEINAFKNNEVFFVDYADPRCDQITRPGPRFVEGLKILAKMVHPELELD